MNIFIAIIIAFLCFFLLGFCVTLVPRGTSLFWALPISGFIFTPALAIGIYVGIKIQHII
ncbi:MAG: hypothetical protein WC332_01520 [Clostridia bacterium]|jgi:hypothetical protein